jgi:hypothetical protein
VLAFCSTIKDRDPLPVDRSDEDDIVAMAMFLASPVVRNIIGQAYNIDGELVSS